MDRNAHIYGKRTKRRDFRWCKMKLVFCLFSCLIHSNLTHQIHRNYNQIKCENMTERALWRTEVLCTLLNVIYICSKTPRNADRCRHVGFAFFNLNRTVRCLVFIRKIPSSNSGKGPHITALVDLLFWVVDINVSKKHTGLKMDTASSSPPYDLQLSLRSVSLWLHAL